MCMHIMKTLKEQKKINKNNSNSPLYVGWFGSVLWHINHSLSFNVKFCFYMYIKYMIFKHIL